MLCTPRSGCSCSSDLQVGWFCAKNIEAFTGLTCRSVLENACLVITCEDCCEQIFFFLVEKTGESTKT